MNTWRKSLSLVLRTQIKKKQKNNKQRSRRKNKRICFDLDALSSSDNFNSCLNSTSSSGDEGGGDKLPRILHFNMFSS